MTGQKFVLFDFDGEVEDYVDVVWQTAQAMHPHFTKDIWLRLFEGNIYHSYKSVQCDERCHVGDEEFFAYYSIIIFLFSIYFRFFWIISSFYCIILFFMFIAVKNVIDCWYHKNVEQSRTKQTTKNYLSHWALYFVSWLAALQS